METKTNTTLETTPEFTTTIVIRLKGKKMKIRRTFKPTSLRSGETEIIDKEKLREIFNQADFFVDGHPFSSSGQKKFQGFIPFESLLIYLGRKQVETFFSSFDLA